MMRILLAPDSFKDCLRSADVCACLAAGIKRVFPDAEVISVPMADGGQGTVDAIVAAGAGCRVEAQAHGPLGAPITASYARLTSRNAAVIEMASVAGLELVPFQLRNPMNTSTFGLGELMLHAVRQGCGELILGLGGSATTDGGAGMAIALGYKLLDKSGASIARGGKGLRSLCRIERPEFSEILCNVSVTAACDVRNPLLGPSGAARVYGPQKGATEEMVEELEPGLANLALRWEADLDARVADTPGAGAAGGLGGGLMAFCGARFRPGAELMMELSGLVEKAKGVDLVVTGEGCTDYQTLQGKTVMSVIRSVRHLVAETAVVSGTVKGDVNALRSELGIDHLMDLKGSQSLEEAIANARHNLEKAGEKLAANFAGRRL